MKKGGANLQEIAYVLDHANYQSLESYLAAPNNEDYERYIGCSTMHLTKSLKFHQLMK